MEEERPRQRTSIHSLSDIYSTRWESFVVTGTKYANEGVIDRVCGYGLDQPDLTLKKDESNSYDCFAVGVYWQNYRVGYLPAKGRTCSECLSKVSAKDVECAECGSRAILNYGLNYRICRTCDFVNYSCYLDAIRRGTNFPLHALLLWQN